MSGELLAAIIGGSIVGFLNLLAFAFTYGKLTQKVDNDDRRLNRLECKVFGEVDK
ncbi:hypothetical protein Dform_00847 [Dehalogenimonas formicexedens]|uniref:Uncharacterized protein n=1 Tax=Dehalogenimonas formicexedens TaxID=1839801 RepID=A0A1P8F767_9CHLR|nr:hypothetical protein [Dehalogenimonas formicexedens]APV44192.1 hypothetical protein Dform_00847 [Dehalogenimonas formicexedens]